MTDSNNLSKVITSLSTYKTHLHDIPSTRHLHDRCSSFGGRGAYYVHHIQSSVLPVLAVLVLELSHILHDLPGIGVLRFTPCLQVLTHHRFLDGHGCTRTHTRTHNHSQARTNIHTCTQTHTYTDKWMHIQQSIKVKVQ